MPTDKIQIKTYVEQDEKDLLDKQASLKGISLAQLIRHALRLDKAESEQDEKGRLPKPHEELDEVIITIARTTYHFECNPEPEYHQVPARLLLDETCPRLGNRRRDCPCANCTFKRAGIASGKRIGEPLLPHTLPRVSASKDWAAPSVGSLARDHTYA